MSEKTARIDVQVLDEHLVRVQVFGKLDAEGAAMVVDALEAHAWGKPYFMIQTVITDITGATPEARRVAADGLRRLPPRVIAIVGGGFAQRMIAKLVLTAVTVLDHHASTTGRFFEDEPSARAWLEEQAAQHESKRSAGA